MGTKKKMPVYDREKVLNLCIKAKMGRRLNEEEQKYVESMWKKYPKDYPKDEEVFKIVNRLMNPLAD